MDPFLIGLLSFPVLLALIFLRIPIGLAMLAVGLAGNWLVIGSPMVILNQLKSQPVGTFSSYSLSIVPMFLLMGQFATISGMSAALFRAAEAWIGHRKGGVAMAAIGACAGFGAICGSSMATAATMGQAALPQLRKYGYSNALAGGTLAAGGTLGVLIPPSVILVIYAILTEQNIAKLFMAALIPGILAAVGYMVAIRLYVGLYPASARSRHRAAMAERCQSLRDTLPVLGVFVLVVGGIYTGIFTPTEAAAIGAALTGILALLSGSLGLGALRIAILDVGRTTAMIFIIILGAAVFNNFLALAQVPQSIAMMIGEIGLSPWFVLTIILLLYLVLGCVMDSLAMILLTVPIFFPILSGMDFGMGAEDFALWFGILVLIVVEVGLITPPVGMNLFVIKAMAPEITMAEMFRGALPFVMTDMVRVVVLVMFPSITLGLVWLFY
ncbi:MAG: TRAP transporter large permease [Paracoccus sp. (in: a-proteobacteria)]|nr:TRAP transporter large permease [Paracoccus sp. (in: a-proteobacteria)]